MQHSKIRSVPALLTAALAGALLLAGCSGSPQETPATAAAGLSSEANGSQVLVAHGLDSISAVEVVDQLDHTRLADRDAELFASVRPGNLLVRGADGAEEVLPLPEDQFYLSFAPYVSVTHDCFYHSLTTCVGELQNENIDLRIVNDADGSVVIDETVTTFDNGFYGIWLPADGQFTLTVDHAGRSVTAPIGTTAEDPTCVTTLQLV